MLQWFTVVLLVPPSEAVAYGEFYLAHIRALDRATAAKNGQIDACEGYGMMRNRADEWPVLLVIAGMHRDCMDLPPITVNGKEIRRLHIARH